MTEPPHLPPLISKRRSLHGEGKDIHGREITLPKLYWSRSLAEEHMLSRNGIIEITPEGIILGHEAMGWRRMTSLPEDAIALT